MNTNTKDIELKPSFSSKENLTPIYDSYMRKMEQENKDVLSLKTTVSNLMKKFGQSSWGHRPTYLLAGQVQSGKTSQVLGVTSRLMDDGIDLVIYMTSDQLGLVDQASKDADCYFSGSGYQILSSDFKRLKYLPTSSFIVVNKNATKLNAIIRELSGATRKPGRILIIDDEADAASLNTNQRKGGEASAVNKAILKLKEMGEEGSLLIQVTATPMGNLLLKKTDPLFPNSAFVFRPGKGYLGGESFYSNQKNICIIPNTDREDVSSGDVPESLYDSVAYYLTLCLIKNRKNEFPRFLCHPGISMNSHSGAEKAINKIIEGIKKSILKNNAVPLEMIESSNRVCAQYGQLNFSSEEWKNTSGLLKILDSMDFLVFNSKNTPGEAALYGADGKPVPKNQIIIGGNSLGRGLRIPHLHVMYFCRESSRPNWDTVWQQCRIFGYDRTQEMVRIFITERQYDLLNKLVVSNQLLFNKLETEDIDKVPITLVYPDGMNATRKNIIHPSSSIFIGGYSHLPLEKDIVVDNADVLNILDKCGLGNHQKMSIDNACPKIFEEILSCVKGDALLHLTCNHIKNAVAAKNKPLRIEVVRNKEIKENYRTVLSEQEQKDIARDPDQMVMYLCELTGSRKQPLWIPIVRFPNGLTFAVGAE